MAVILWRAFLVLLWVRQSIVAWVNSIFGTYCKGAVGKRAIKFWRVGAGCMRGLNNPFPAPGEDDVHRQFSLGPLSLLPKGAPWKKRIISISATSATYTTSIESYSGTGTSFTTAGFSLPETRRFSSLVKVSDSEAFLVCGDNQAGIAWLTK